MASQTQDRIGWRQIGVGYVICLCSAIGMAAALWADRVPLLEAAITAALVLATLVLTWVEPHARQFQASWLAANPEMDLGLKRGAVIVLCVVSLATTALGVVVWRIMFFS